MNKKYFIAIVLPEPFQSQVREFNEQLFKQFNLKGALRSPAHITLHRPFEWKVEKEHELVTKLKEFKFDSTFKVELQNFNCFKPRVVYVDVMRNELMYELHKQLKYYAQANLKLYNEVEDMRGFHPHVTIAFRDLKKNRFDEVWTEFKNKTYKAEFDYAGFSLLRLEEKWEECTFFEKR